MPLKYKIFKVLITFFILIAIGSSGFFILKFRYINAAVLKNQRPSFKPPEKEDKVSNKDYNAAATLSARGLTKPLRDFHAIYYGNYGKDVLLADYILSKLGYLPLNCVIKEKHKKVKFIWKWKYKNIPVEVKSKWKPGYFNTLIKSAVMNFQYEQRLIVTGAINKSLWKVLIKDYLKKSGINYWGIYYTIVNKNFPETISIWRNGNIIFTSLANTGITEAPTNDGVFPIYLKFFTTNMSGTTPWKTKYDDTDIPFVNYFNGGEALHGFPRGIYGVNQSMGCVELPIIDSYAVWKKLSYGSLIIVKKYIGEKPAYNEKLRPKKFHLKLKLKQLKQISRKFKLLYVEHSYAYNGVPLAYIRLFYSKRNKVNDKTILTTDINYASNINFISIGRGRGRKLRNKLIFFSDTKSLEGTFDRSVYCFMLNNPGNIQMASTVRHKNEGILSNIAVNRNKIWFILYQYKHGKLKDYLEENTFSFINGRIKTYPARKIKLNFYSSYLTFDSHGNLWMSGLTPSGNGVVNYIKMLGYKSIKANNKIKSKGIKTIYSFKGHFYGTMPFLVENDGSIFILKHSYYDNDFLNDLIEIRKNAKNNLSILNITNFKGLIGNFTGNIKGNIFFIKNYLKRGIFQKDLYEISTGKTTNKVHKIFSFYGNSNGVVNNILLVNK